MAPVVVPPELLLELLPLLLLLVEPLLLLLVVPPVLVPTELRAVAEGETVLPHADTAPSSALQTPCTRICFNFIVGMYMAFLLSDDAAIAFL
jgi:hypothetical protein